MEVDEELKQLTDRVKAELCEYRERIDAILAKAELKKTDKMILAEALHRSWMMAQLLKGNSQILLRSGEEESDLALQVDLKSRELASAQEKIKYLKE